MKWLFIYHRDLVVCNVFLFFVVVFFVFLFFFLHFFISFKYDFHVDTEKMIVKT